MPPLNVTTNVEVNYLLSPMRPFHLSLPILKVKTWKLEPENGPACRVNIRSRRCSFPCWPLRLQSAVHQVTAYYGAFLIYSIPCLIFLLRILIRAFSSPSDPTADVGVARSGLILAVAILAVLLWGNVF